MTDKKKSAEDQDLSQEGRKPDDEAKPVDPLDSGTGGHGPEADTGDSEATGSGPSGGGDAPVPEH